MCVCVCACLCAHTCVCMFVNVFCLSSAMFVLWTLRNRFTFFFVQFFKCQCQGSVRLSPRSAVLCSPCVGPFHWPETRPVAEQMLQKAFDVVNDSTLLELFNKHVSQSAMKLWIFKQTQDLCVQRRSIASAGTPLPSHLSRFAEV